MIPSIRSLYLFCLLLPLAFLPIFFGDTATILWFIALMGIMSFLCLRLYTIFPFRRSDVSLDIAPTMYVGSLETIKITVDSSLNFPVSAKIRLEASGTVEWQQEDTVLQIQPGENEFTISMRPLRRESIVISQITIRIFDTFHFWMLEKTTLCHIETHVVPNIKNIRKDAIRFYGTPETRTGIKIERHRGQGSEFDALREYIQGFDIRTIDWKVSARKGKMVCREFRAEKNHDVILALDCGHLMAAEFKGLTKLDYAINALLTIAYVGIMSGDRIGFFSFSRQIISFLPPRNQMSIVERISRECTGLTYSFEPTNFVLSMNHLIHTQRKRSLIIVISDFVDSVSAETMKDYLYILSKRHLVLFVAIRDPFLDEYIHENPNKTIDLYNKVACYDLRDERYILLQELQRMGIHYLDLPPQEISIPVLNKYIDIRRKEQI